MEQVAQNHTGRKYQGDSEPRGVRSEPSLSHLMWPSHAQQSVLILWADSWLTRLLPPLLHTELQKAGIGHAQGQQSSPYVLRAESIRVAGQEGEGTRGGAAECRKMPSVFVLGGGGSEDRPRLDNVN